MEVLWCIFGEFKFFGYFYLKLGDFFFNLSGNTVWWTGGPNFSIFEDYSSNAVQNVQQKDFVSFVNSVHWIILNYLVIFKCFANLFIKQLFKAFQASLGLFQGKTLPPFSISWMTQEIWQILGQKMSYIIPNLEVGDI